MITYLRYGSCIFIYLLPTWVNVIQVRRRASSWGPSQAKKDEVACEAIAQCPLFIRSFPRFPKAANEHTSIHLVEHATPPRKNALPPTEGDGSDRWTRWGHRAWPLGCPFSFSSRLIPCHLHHLCAWGRWRHEDLRRAHLSLDLCMTLRWRYSFPCTIP